MTPFHMSPLTRKAFAELPHTARREFTDWLHQRLILIEKIHQQENEDIHSRARSRARARSANHTVHMIREEIAEILYPLGQLEKEQATDDQEMLQQG